MKKQLCVLAALVAGAAAGPAMALDFSFTPFNQIVFNDGAISGIDPEHLLLAGVPGGTYTGYIVLVDWSANAGDPWSNEAIFAFADAPFSTPPTVYYADPGISGASANNGASVTLSWAGDFTTPYQGGDPLYFLMGQTFAGSTANWDNVRITLVPTPGSLGLLAMGGLFAARRRRA